MYRQIRQQYVYGNINQLESLMEANLQVYTPNTRFWWRMQVLEYGLQIWQSAWHHRRARESLRMCNVNVDP